IETVTEGLKTLGVHIRSRKDGFEVRGVPTRPNGGLMPSNGDHRIAMLGAVTGVVSRDGVEVEGADAVAISFPGFFDLLNSVSRR
ncbi:MAG: 3-phosphoshikimate 1-carboxyvinyltransferase, partial [Gaiellaceae bacterium]